MGASPLVCTILTENGGNVDATDFSGWTPLYFAVQSGSLETVRILIDKGADVNAVSAKGGTRPIHIGAVGAVDILTFLIQAHAEVFVADDKGRRPMHLAASGGLTSHCSVILQHGEDVHILDANEASVVFVVVATAVLLRLTGMVINVVENATALRSGIRRHRVRGISDFNGRLFK